MKNTEEPVMYIVVNKNLNMKKGKTAAQAAHSAVKAARYAESKEEYYNYWKEWYTKSYTKIVLEASEFEMKGLITKYRDICFETYDEGRTQINKGSLTTIAFVPLPKNDSPEELRKLKLLG